jgi:hypothetical protein
LQEDQASAKARRNAHDVARSYEIISALDDEKVPALAVSPVV